MKKLSNVILLVFVCALTFVFAEFFVRKIIPAKIYTDERNLTYSYDDTLGWFPIKNLETKYQGVNLINVKNNNIGFRDVEYDEFLRNKKPNILFIGDSFVWGYDVEAEDRFTEILRKKIGNKYNIFNFGVSGYGTDQEFLLLKKYYDEFKPKMVFIILCQNDYDNNSANVVYHGYYKPYFVSDGSKLSLNGYPIKVSGNYKILKFEENYPILARSHIAKWSSIIYERVRYNMDKKTLKDPTKEIFLEVKKFLNEKGSKLVVGTIEDDKEIHKFFLDNNISYINLSDAQRYNSHGNHWTPKGNDFVASEIFKFLNNSK